MLLVAFLKYMYQKQGLGCKLSEDICFLCNRAEDPM